MSYQVIARKWRPQSFADMVGQETVSRTLQNALKSGRIAHAFLFSGVRGVGKTTTARILAKALNCHQGVSDHPCGECVSCQEITVGNSVDVQEIDAASNRGIDSIRELREGARYGTARDRFKIYIVDEVHMLTNEAFNALLKTLEEPPAHVKFILATTEYHKLPTTITSRCQKYEFRPMPFAAIFGRLKLITESEGVRISDYALGAVTSVAQGSMRDAQSALDQLIAFGGSEVRDEDVRALLGLVDQQVVWQLVDAVAEQDRQKLIAGLHELVGTGLSPQLLCGKLVEHVRNLMVCRAVGWNPSLLQVADSDREALVSQAERFSELDLIRFYDLLDRVAGELKWHTHPNVHLEISLLKLVELAKLASIEEVIGSLMGGGRPSGVGGPPPGRSGPSGGGGRRDARSGPAIDPNSAFQPPSTLTRKSETSRPAAAAPPAPWESNPAPAQAPDQRPPEKAGNGEVAESAGGSPQPGSADAAGNGPIAAQTSGAEGAARESARPTTGAKEAVADRPPSTAGESFAEVRLTPVTHVDGTDVVARLMRSLNDNFKSLHGQLACASRISFRDGRLEIRFPHKQSFHAGMMQKQEGQQRLSEALATITGSEVEIGIVVEEEPEAAAPKVEPTEDPKVKAFLARFPGKIVVKREYEP